MDPMMGLWLISLACAVVLGAWLAGGLREPRECGVSTSDWRTYALRLEDSLAEVTMAVEHGDPRDIRQAAQRAETILEAGPEGL